MCDCKVNTEEKLKSHYSEKMPDARDLEAKLMGYAITFGVGLSFRPYMPVELKHKVIVKKTGIEKIKTEKSNMFFSFCPFCGEKIKAD